MPGQNTAERASAGGLCGCETGCLFANQMEWHYGCCAGLGRPAHIELRLEHDTGVDCQTAWSCRLENRRVGIREEVACKDNYQQLFLDLWVTCFCISQCSWLVRQIRLVCHLGASTIQGLSSCRLFESSLAWMGRSNAALELKWQLAWCRWRTARVVLSRSKACLCASTGANEQWDLRDAERISTYRSPFLGDDAVLGRLSASPCRRWPWPCWDQHDFLLVSTNVLCICNVAHEVGSCCGWNEHFSRALAWTPCVMFARVVHLFQQQWAGLQK